MKPTILLAASLIPTATVAMMPCSKKAFNKILPSNSTTLYAVEVPEGGTFGVASDLSYPTNATNLPALCAVAFNVTSSSSSSFTFGIFLPKQWSKRLFTAGNGGFAGGINWLSMAEGLEEGFACVSTDTGHNVSDTNDGTWAYNAPEKIKDWTGRALHSSVQQAKTIVSAYYGSDAKYSYYSGCSTGGYQGLKEVQTYPEDFDGVLVGSPAVCTIRHPLNSGKITSNLVIQWWHSHLQTWSIQVALWNQPSDAPYHIPDSLFSVIGAEVMNQCDGADGVLDGIISAPKSCDFHPEALLCTSPAADKSECLTAPQVELLYNLYNNWYEGNNEFVFPQYSYGSEFQWSMLSSGTEESGFSEQFAKYIMYQNPEWTVANFSYQTVLDAERVCKSVGLDADNFDLTPFHHKQGKLLHYVGLADGLIPPGSSEYYHNHVVQTMAPQGVNVTDFYRLFTIPGMGHCAYTSSSSKAPWYINGASQAGSLGTGVRGVPGYQDAGHDALRALIKWVEEDVGPNKIVATKYKNDNVEDGVLQQRPLCVYPGRATFRGGDMTKPENWYCEN